MQKNNFMKSWLALIMMLVVSMSMTSCQGLVDAIFGEDAQPAESSKPSTDPKKPTTPTTFDAKTTPLTLEALVANTVVTINLMEGIALSSVDYSTDGTTWTALTSNPQKITLAAVGDKLMLRGSNGSYATADKETTITCSSAAATRGLTRGPATDALCKIYGNTSSLLKKEGFSSITKLTEDYTFRRLFMDAAIDIDLKKELLLPAEKLTKACYKEMFKGNKKLSVTPVLPAKELVTECYQEMFEDCSSLSAVTMLATSVEAKATDYVTEWLKEAGTDPATGEDPVLVVSEESTISIAELTADAGDNWVVMDESEKVIATGIEIKWDGKVLDIDKDTPIDMTVGEEKALTATLLPKEAEGEVKLSVSDDEILKIDNEKGTVTALKAGTATISAVDTKDDKIAVEFKVNVEAVKVTSITLDPTTLTKTVGADAVTLKATVAPDDATDKTLTWTSDKETVATVDADGKVSFVGVGTATITATANDGSDVKATCAVTVTAAGHALSSAAVGEIICSDSKAYAAADKDYLPSGVTALAMVAYVGNGSDCDHGLAIALKDENNGEKMVNWNTVVSTCSGKTPTVTGGTWRLPSIKDWQNILIGCGTSATVIDYPAHETDRSYSGLAAKLSAAGGDAFLNPRDYWASTISNVHGENYTFRIWFQTADNSKLCNNTPKNDGGWTINARAVLAF